MKLTAAEAIAELQKVDTIDMPARLCEAHYMAIKALEQEPIAQERYEDLCEYFGGVEDFLKNRDDFKAWLDRVKWHIHKAEELYEKYEQEPKKGHWIDINGIYAECSNCNEEIYITGDFKYCPNCGAKMEEEEC